MEIKTKTPYYTWRKNKWRIDMGFYTKRFIKEHFQKGILPLNSEPGRIYAIEYKVNPEIETDKYHVKTFVLSLGRFLNETPHMRALNLMYLKPDVLLQYLDHSHTLFTLNEKNMQNRAFSFFNFHERLVKDGKEYMMHNFEEKRIVSIKEIPVDSWGMLVLLKRYQLGTFNESDLRKDYIKESKKFEDVPVLKAVSRRKKVVDKKEETILSEAEKMKLQMDLDLNEMDYED